MASFARHFKQEAIADVDLVIRCLSDADGDAEPAPKRARTVATTAAADPLQLVVSPAHKIILFTSEYFDVQASPAIVCCMLLCNCGCSCKHSIQQRSNSASAG
jgi:hypothetical protein